MEDARLIVNGQELALPVIQGSEGEVAIDISTLRKQTGITTFDRGFGNTAEAQSAITFIDGEKGILRYRGYPIEELATNADFLEVAWLLSNGDLPTGDELTSFTHDITSHSLVREDMKHLFEAFPHTAHPMQILASEVSAMASYYPDALDPYDPESVRISTTRLISKVITMAAWSYKYRVHQPYVYPRNDLDYSSRFLHMMFSVPAEEYEPDPVIAQAMNTLFILHADHEQNCSASTVRIVGSGQANLFSSVSSGINALSGPLHGGANQSVVEMLAEMVEQPGDVKAWIARAKDKEDPFRLMGLAIGYTGTSTLVPGSSNRSLRTCWGSSDSTTRCWRWRWSSNRLRSKTSTSWIGSSIQTSISTPALSIERWVSRPTCSPCSLPSGGCRVG